jgi:hypothetical protein
MAPNQPKPKTASYESSGAGATITMILKVPYKGA